MLMEAFSDQMAQSWLKGHPSDSFPTLGLELGDGASLAILCLFSLLNLKASNRCSVEIVTQS
jgi:hypothetical protein